MTRARRNTRRKKEIGTEEEVEEEVHEMKMWEKEFKRHCRLGGDENARTRDENAIFQ